MTLRLAEMIVKKKVADSLSERLSEYDFLEHRQIQLPDEQILIRIILDPEQNQPIFDLLKELKIGEDYRVVTLPVQSVLPLEKIESELISNNKNTAKGVNQEELYETISDAAKFSWIYLALMIMSTIVAAVGLLENNIVLVIGAMVIAPLLGPNVALGLAVTLGDLELMWHALLTSMIWIFVAAIIAFILGLIMPIDPLTYQITLRTKLGLSDVVMALASGCAGTLAFTKNASSSLIGVMVAVALLPTLVAFGLLLGSGQNTLAINALLLFLISFVCVNLACLGTFLLQDIRPFSWWDKKKATKLSFIAIVLWFIVLLMLAGLIALLHGF